MTKYEEYPMDFEAFFAANGNGRADGRYRVSPTSSAIADRFPHATAVSVE